MATTEINIMKIFLIVISVLKPHNGSANNRHRFKLLMNVEFLNYYRIQKKQVGVRLICLVMCTYLILSKKSGLSTSPVSLFIMDTPGEMQNNCLRSGSTMNK